MRIMPRMSLKNALHGFLLGLLWLTACQAAAPQVPPTAAGALPYVTMTPWSSPTAPTVTPPQTGDQAILLPSPTATPRSYTIVKGDDMLGIALRNGLTLAELKTANPQAHPNLLAAGSTLSIPAAATAMPEGATMPSPTPLPAEISGPFCYLQADRALICLALALNRGDTAQENLALRVRAGAQDGLIEETEAYGLLDVLPAGGEMPFAVRFPPPMPEGAAWSAELVRGHPFAARERYALVRESDISVRYAADHASAALTGGLTAEQDVRRLRLAAWGFDQQGRLAAARVWETARDIPAGETTGFTLELCSLGGELAGVRWRAEALR